LKLAAATATRKRKQQQSDIGDESQLPKKKLTHRHNVIESDHEYDQDMFLEEPEDQCEGDWDTQNPGEDDDTDEFEEESNHEGMRLYDLHVTKCSFSYYRQLRNSLPILGRLKILFVFFCSIIMYSHCPL
jgi:hypothetical protein